MNERKPNTKCHQCGDACYIRPNQMATQSKWFCSRACYFSNRAEDGLVTEKICPKCLVSFKRRDSNGKYCSRKCSNEARTGIKYTGEQTASKYSKVVGLRKWLTDNYGYQCSLCSLGSEWNGRPITLQVDHIDGNNKNNRLDNLRLLCPNCHSQTETFGAKNIGRWPKN